MTHEVSNINERKFEWMDRAGAEDKELKMQKPKGQATTKALIFIIVLILIAFFFLG
jgi:hypothetical protein